MDKKLNIAMFSDSFFPIVGGRETVIHNLIKALNKNANCFLATPKIKRKNLNFSDAILGYKVLRCNSIRVSKNEYLSIPNKQFKKQIEELAKNKKIDLIHIQTKYGLAGYAFKLKKKYGIPVVASAHTDYIMQYKKQLKIPFIYNIFLHRVKNVLNKSDAIFTVSEHMQKVLKDIGVNKNAYIIPNATDLKDLTPNPSLSKLDICNKYNLAQDVPLFVYVGRLVETKNISLLLNSLAKLKQNNINFNMLFVGNGNIKKYSKLCAKLNITNCCTFTGAITDRVLLAEIIKASDINICPSVIESFGLTVIEAGVLKTPSIVMNGCATSENITHNLNGFVSDTTIDALCQTITNAINNKNLKQIGENASITLPKTWEEVSTIHIQKYKELINKNAN